MRYTYALASLHVDVVVVVEETQIMVVRFMIAYQESVSELETKHPAVSATKSMDY